MARGTKEQKQAAEVASDFPYLALMTHPAWAVIDGALGELESNNDMELTTARRYVVGFLIQKLIDHDLLQSPATNGQRTHTTYDRRHRSQNHSKLVATIPAKNTLKKIGLTGS
jgi:hypothetical protein